MIGCRPTYLPVTERLLGSHDFFKVVKGNSCGSSYLKIGEAAGFVSEKFPFASPVTRVASIVNVFVNLRSSRRR